MVCLPFPPRVSRLRASPLLNFFLLSESAQLRRFPLTWQRWLRSRLWHLSQNTQPWWDLARLSHWSECGGKTTSKSWNGLVMMMWHWRRLNMPAISGNIYVMWVSCKRLGFCVPQWHDWRMARQWMFPVTSRGMHSKIRQSTEGSGDESWKIMAEVMKTCWRQQFSKLNWIFWSHGQLEALMSHGLLLRHWGMCSKQSKTRKISCTTWDVQNPENKRINYQPHLVSRNSFNNSRLGYWWFG